MALKVTFNHPNFPKGMFFDTAFGRMENGVLITLTEDQERMVLANQGKTVKDYTAGNEMFKVEGTPELKAAEVTAAMGVDVSDTAPVPTLEERQAEFDRKAERKGEGTTATATATSVVEEKGGET